MFYVLCEGNQMSVRHARFPDVNFPQMTFFAYIVDGEGLASIFCWSSIFEYNQRLYSLGGLACNDRGFEQSICASWGHATIKQH